MSAGKQIARAQRAAKAHGYRLRKSRRHLGSASNHGKFMIVDLASNFAVAGFAYDLSAAEALEFLGTGTAPNRQRKEAAAAQP